MNPHNETTNREASWHNNRCPICILTIEEAPPRNAFGPLLFVTPMRFSPANSDIRIFTVDDLMPNTGDGK
jgi:hypothetical protein